VSELKTKLGNIREELKLMIASEKVAADFARTPELARKHQARMEALWDVQDLIAKLEQQEQRR
jgi:hypothetical protein